MIWVLDQDTYDWQALAGLLDLEVNGNSLLLGGSLSESGKRALAKDLSAYTSRRLSCYCVGELEHGAVQRRLQCSWLYSFCFLGIVETPDKKLCKSGLEGYEDAQYRLICCPTEAMPEGCSWQCGSDFGLCTGGDDLYGDCKYKLVADSHNNHMGAVSCLINKPSLWCNTNTELE